MVALDRTVSRSRAGLATRVYEIDALTGAWNNDGSGATADQTASIQAQIDAIPDGSIIRFPVGKSGGKYYTQGNLGSNARGANGILRFANRRNLIVEGPSAADPATFYTTEPAVPFGSSVNNNTQSLRRHFWFDGCENITVRNIRVEGSNYTYSKDLAVGNPFFWDGGPDQGGNVLSRGYRDYWELEHAFEFRECVSCLIEDCEASDIWGDGVHVIGSGTDRIVGRRLALHGTGRQGIAISRGTNILFDDIAIGTEEVRPRRAGVDLEPVLSWVIDGVEISNVDMWQGSGVPVAALGRSRVDNIHLHDWVIRSGSAGFCQVRATDGTRRSNWRLENITSLAGHGSPQATLRFTRVDGIHIENTTFLVSAAQSRRCLDFDDCRGGIIVKDTTWTPGGCWIDYDSESTRPDLLGTNTFAGDCGADPLRNQ